MSTDTLNTADVEHQSLVRHLTKSGSDILSKLLASECHLIHMAMGISGESGELLDAIKKHTIYGKELDLENVIEELGDIEFYMEGLRASLGITRGQVLRANTAKLLKRYSKGSYSNEAAIAREDKIS